MGEIYLMLCRVVHLILKVKKFLAILFIQVTYNNQMAGKHYKTKMKNQGNRKALY